MFVQTAQACAFGHTSLFIDDCPDLTGCYRNISNIAAHPVGVHPGRSLRPLLAMVEYQLSAVQPEPEQPQ